MNNSEVEQFGSSGNDVAIASSQADFVSGLGGDDLLTGKDGNDSLFGGAGNDSIESGRGNNLLWGEEGNDILIVSNSRPAQAGNNTLNGGAGEDKLSGGDASDFLAGGQGQDIILGKGGDDNLEGGYGADGLNGGQGRDILSGGGGNDQIEGGDDNDLLFGGEGNDLLRGLEGKDSLWGGTGEDYFALIPNTGEDRILDFQDGRDKLVLTSTPAFGEELSFEQLSITQNEGNTVIALKSSNEVLATLQDTSTDTIDRDDFITQPEIESQFEIINPDSVFGLSSSNPDGQNNTNTANSESSTPAGDDRSVVSQGVEVLKVDNARQQYGVDGSGITIGVMSDSFSRSQNTTVTAEDDVNSGDLPGNDNSVKILDDSADNSLFLSNQDASLDDEGRAMVQLIHDVAPGANIVFYTAFNGPDDFASGIDELTAAGADIIVDDVVYTEEPFFQDGVIAQAANRAVENGVAYFSSAGNFGSSSYEAEFRPVTADGFPISGLEKYTFHDFNPAAEVDITQNFTLDPGGSISLSFQWDEPFASAGGKGANSDLDIFVLDKDNNIVAVAAESNIGGDAVELLDFTNSSDRATEYKLLIGQETVAGGSPPNLIKYIDLSSGTAEAQYASPSSTIFGHRNASGVETIGASFYQTPTELEPFSSVGTTPILFDRSGTRLSESQVREKPELVAPDGVNTTFFGQTDIDDDGLLNFFGTSAAAPHAAGVAALLLEANPQSTPEEIYRAMESTAIDVEYSMSYEDIASNFGLIQADSAIAALNDL